MRIKEGTRQAMLYVVRWTARLWSVGTIVLVLTFIVGEGIHLTRRSEMIGFIFFPVGICLGLVVAWWHEGLGGGITVASLIFFYSVSFASTGSLPRGAAWVVFAFPGFLFLFYWAASAKPVLRAHP